MVKSIRAIEALEKAKMRIMAKAVIEEKDTPISVKEKCLQIIVDLLDEELHKE